MDVTDQLAAIRRVVEEARSMPMSASAVVNRTELLTRVDELDVAISNAMSEATKVIAERDTVVQGGRLEAEELVRQAESERDQRLSDTEVFRLAQREADEVRETARREADELRRETDEYVDAKLATFEIALERTMEAVRRGRERLAAEQNGSHHFSDEEIESIRLPEHLEG